MLDSGTFLLSPVGSCVRFTCEKQGVGLGWGNLLIAVRFWLNFRIPTVAFSGVDVSPAQCARCTWVFGRSGVERGGRVNSYMIVPFGPGSPIHSRGNYMDTTKGDPPNIYNTSMVQLGVRASSPLLCLEVLCRVLHEKLRFLLHYTHSIRICLHSACNQMI